MKRYVYISMCFDDLPTTRDAISRVESAGHVVVSSWIRDAAAVNMTDVLAPQVAGMVYLSDLVYADTFLFLPSKCRDAYFEMGVAFGRDLEIFAVGDVDKATAETRHPVITWVTTVEAAIAMWR